MLNYQKQTHAHICMHAYVNTHSSQPINQRTKPNVLVEIKILFYPPTYPLVDSSIYRSIDPLIILISMPII